jgi:hypothetical protein
VQAICSTAPFLLIIIEAFKYSKFPTLTQYIALALGVYGTLVMVLPENMAKIFCFCCHKKLHPPADKVKQDEDAIIELMDKM